MEGKGHCRSGAEKELRLDDWLWMVVLYIKPSMCAQSLHSVLVVGNIFRRPIVKTVN
jgi:hypothetical protein